MRHPTNASSVFRFGSPIGWALLVHRLNVGGITLWFGVEKLAKFRPLLVGFPDPLGLGPSASLILTVLAQVPCAALVLLGFQTRVAAIPPLITMLVAALIVHAHDPDIYIRNALIYAGGFLVLIISGPGKFSVDHSLFPLAKRTASTNPLDAKQKTAADDDSG